MDIRKLSREDALKLHNEMWSDMQSDLGDNPSDRARNDYKSEWCDKKFPNYNVAFNCFLCEYAEQRQRACGEYEHYDRCEFCPIDWRELSRYKYADGEVCKCHHPYINGYWSSTIYNNAPISDLLALPERK